MMVKGLSHTPRVSLPGWQGWSLSLAMLTLALLLGGCGGGGGGNGASAPTKVTVTPGGGGGGGGPLIISWTAPNPLGSDGNPLVIAAFNVYRGTTANNLILLGTVTVNNNPPIASETTFADNTATSGNTFFYAVSAVATNGSEGPRSATVSGVAP